MRRFTQSDRSASVTSPGASPGALKSRTGRLQRRVGAKATLVLVTLSLTAGGATGYALSARGVVLRSELASAVYEAFAGAGLTTTSAGPSTSPGPRTAAAVSSREVSAADRDSSLAKASAASPKAPVAASQSPYPFFHGVLEFAGNNSAADAANPDLAGVVLVYYWSQLEPAKGVYDWALVTSEMEPWVADGKKVVLRVATAGQASWDPPYSGSGTPQWVYSDGAPAVNDSGETMPVYWNPTYLSDLSTFLKAYAAEFDGNPNIAFIEAGIGMGGETKPETNLSPSGLAEWEAAGYTDAVWMSTVQTISGYYRQDFARTPVYALVTSSFLDDNWPGYEALVSWFTSASPPWYLQNDALSSTSALPDPAAWAKASGLVLEQGEPTRISGDTLASDLDNGLAQKAGYILVFKEDIDNPAYASTLAQVASYATPANS